MGHIIRKLSWMVAGLVFVAIAVLTPNTSYNSFAIGVNTLDQSDSVPLYLEVELGNTTFHNGDEVRLSYVVRNATSRPIHFLPWGGETGSWLDTYDSMGKKLEKWSPLLRLTSTLPSKSDFVLVEPEKPYRKSFRGHIRNGDIRSPDNKSVIYTGWYLEFEEATFLLPGPGHYFCKGRYICPPGCKERAAKLSNKDTFWCDDLESQQIPFQVIEKV